MESDQTTWHRLSEVDREARTGICSICGPTRIVLKYSRNQVRCGTKHHQTKRKSPAHKKYMRTYTARQNGMILEDYDTELTQRWEQQEGKCAICQVVLTVGTGKYALDHDHRSGKIRSVLCGSCNRGIGLLQDDPNIVLNAAAYLIQWGAGVPEINGGMPAQIEEGTLPAGKPRAYNPGRTA